MFLLSLMTAFSAHAAVTVTQFSAAEILNYTTDYSYKCVPLGSGKSADYNDITDVGSVSVTTTSGTFSFEVRPEGHSSWSPNKNLSNFQSPSAACADFKDVLAIALNTELNDLFDVKSADITPGRNNMCLVKELRVTHDGPVVKDHSYVYKVVHCP